MPTGPIAFLLRYRMQERDKLRICRTNSVRGKPRVYSQGIAGIHEIIFSLNTSRILQTYIAAEEYFPCISNLPLSRSLSECLGWTFLPSRVQKGAQMQAAAMQAIVEGWQHCTDSCATSEQAGRIFIEAAKSIPLTGLFSRSPITDRRPGFHIV